MKDQVFAGPDVAGAVSAAARALGVADGALRYVVLDKGSAGGRGLAATPARIAVLGPGVAPGPDADPGGPAPGPPEEPASIPARLRGLVRSLAETAGIDLAAEVEEAGEALVVRLQGSGATFLLEEEGEVLRALEHVLQRTAGRQGPRVRIEGEGLQGQRETGLRDQALELARAVRADGVPRVTAPLNSYERRLVHVALAGEPDLETFSVGEGPERRVTVSPRRDPGPREEP